MPFGVSNSFKRGTVKTYTRQRPPLEEHCSDEQPRKRICMDPSGRAIEKGVKYTSQQAETSMPVAKQGEDARFPPQAATEEAASSTTAPSSPPPADRTSFSSDASPSESDLSSLPSSPPQMPSPILPSRTPAFSFLKRKRSDVNEKKAIQPLATITPNAQRNTRPMKKALTQMQIDLGGEVRKTCRACGMEYIPSVKEDAALHKEYCGMNEGGIEIGRLFLKDESVKRLRSNKVASSDKEAIMVVDQRSSLAARNKAKRMLAVVNAELGAADLNEDQLWGQTNDESDERRSIGKRKGVPGIEKRAEGFKVFLHSIGDRCVSFCLVEKISNAFPVVSGNSKSEDGEEIMSTSKSSSIFHSTSAEIVLLGVSRIWTSKSHRGEGLATSLLDCARSNFFYGVEVPRHLVAFSQPTESGGKLAERWFNSQTGWHVYHGRQF